MTTTTQRQLFLGATLGCGSGSLGGRCGRGAGSRSSSPGFAFALGSFLLRLLACGDQPIRDLWQSDWRGLVLGESLRLAQLRYPLGSGQNVAMLIQGAGLGFQTTVKAHGMKSLSKAWMPRPSLCWTIYRTSFQAAPSIRGQVCVAKVTDIACLALPFRPNVVDLLLDGFDLGTVPARP
jgi:hypothetical protein